MGHVHLRVADDPETVAFYRDVLGFGLMAQLGRQAAFLGAGGYHHHVGANTWESAGAPPAPPGRPLRRATIVLPDAGRARAACSSGWRGPATPRRRGRRPDRARPVRERLAPDRVSPPSDIADQTDLRAARCAPSTERVMTDPIIGFIFTDVAHLDLEAHVPVIADFWETVLLGGPHGYRGGASRPHARAEREGPTLRGGRFVRWLAL